ncbi:hypothetical protein [Streptomyces sp. 135]|uniref:hypothetical protein n=1 Tax=Streptomyces sp. 135 TaxID=2838850 RepID=UPI001CC0887D|nr:hypothetical protein [Streptomyces sp. 135]
MSMILTGQVTLDSDHPVETQGSDFSTFTRVTFPTPFPEGSQVIVLTQVQTFNGPHTPGVRIANVNRTGFHIRMNELFGANIMSDGVHTTETIGWLATTV